MHIHLGIAHAISVFLLVASIGLFWRIAASCLVTSDSVVLNDIGKAMGLIY